MKVIKRDCTEARFEKKKIYDAIYESYEKW